jgi:hypothetical protein
MSEFRRPWYQSRPGRANLPMGWYKGLAVVALAVAVGWALVRWVLDWAFGRWV